MTLGTKINKKYRNLSVLITEQVRYSLGVHRYFLSPLQIMVLYVCPSLDKFVSANRAETPQEGRADGGKQCAQISC